MNVLFLSPQPFFQERGSPIAVRLLLEQLTQHDNTHYDLLAYNCGTDIKISNTEVHRSYLPAKNIRPGISCLKLIADLFFTVKSWRLLKSKRYKYIHALEESVFIAWLFKKLYGIPYIYDMDSCLSLQLCDSWIILKPFKKALECFEKAAIRNADLTVAMCQELVDYASNAGAKQTYLLPDVAMYSKIDNHIDLKHESTAPSDAKLVLYVGNLEKYQGIDLLLNAFKHALTKAPGLFLIVIGGENSQISTYKNLAYQLKITDKTAFIGPRPINKLSSYLNSADILVSPRIHGNNTPMKIYSYMLSGKPIVATNLVTHTQVLSPSNSILTTIDPIDFGNGIATLAIDPSLATKLGHTAKEEATEKYSELAFATKAHELYKLCSSL